MLVIWKFYYFLWISKLFCKYVPMHISFTAQHCWSFWMCIHTKILLYCKYRWIYPSVTCTSPAHSLILENFFPARHALSKFDFSPFLWHKADTFLWNFTLRHNGIMVLCLFLPKHCASSVCSSFGPASAAQCDGGVGFRSDSQRFTQRPAFPLLRAVETGTHRPHGK